MGYISLLCEWRDHNQGNTEAGIGEVARRAACAMAAGAPVIRQQIHRRNAVRTDRRLRWNVIIKPTELVVCEDEYRILPRRAGHQGIDQRFDLGRSGLYVSRGYVRIYGRMLIGSADISRLDHGDLRQCAGGG